MYIMYFEIVIKFILALSAINYLFISELKWDMFDLFQNKNITRIMYVGIALIGLYFLFNRNYYLPFLGPTVIPIPEGPPPKNLINMTLHNLPKNTRIIYWAANPSDKISEDPFNAYNSYENSGVGKTDSDGTIVMRLACPGKYKVGKFKRLLKRHVHFRYEHPVYKGMFSKVFTTLVDC